MRKKIARVVSVTVLGLFPLSGFAEAEVVDYSRPYLQNQNSSNAASTAALPPSQQSGSQLDLLNRIEQLQQEVQKLRGQIDVQAHDIQELKKSISATTTTHHTNNINAADIAADVKHVTEATGSLTEQRAYQTAYELIRKRRLPEATAAMEKFLKKYPTSQYAASAHYWLGELHFLQEDNEKAIDEFNIVINDYSDTTKLPDARLKLGLIYYNTGKIAKSREQFNILIKQYPNTTSARLAESRLKALKSSTKS